MKKFFLLLFYLFFATTIWSQNLPVVDFTGFTGSNLSSISPGWSEGEGIAAPSGTSAGWTNGSFANVAANGPATRINLYNANDDDWIVSPMFRVQPSASVEYDLALTEFFNGNATSLGSDDLFQVRVSTDGGLNFSVLRSYSDTSVISNTGQHDLISLDQFVGQDIILGFYASEGTVDDPEDNDVHLDNIQVINPAAIDLEMVSILTPTGASCFSNTEAVEVLIKNSGMQMLNFAANNTPVTVSVTGAGTFTASTTLISGNLMPNATQSVLITTGADFAATGTYDLSVYASYPGDLAPSNDSAKSRIISVPTLTGPVTEDLETFVDDGGFSGDGTGLMNGWINSPAGPASNNYNWSVNTGGPTGSSSTGPDQDHTTGSGTYMYTESSNGATGDQTTLLSPCIDISGLTAPGLSFWYHMYGATIGALEVYMIDGAGAETMVFTASGAQQNSGTDPWLESLSNLTGTTGPIQLKFVATKGSSSTGDISIDDIRVFELPTTNMEMTQILSPVGTACFSNNESVVVEITNKGLVPLDLSANNVNIVVEVNGAPAYNTTANTGTLAVDSSVIVTVSSAADFSTPGTYQLKAYLSVADDGSLLNDTIEASIISLPILQAPLTEDLETFVDDGGFSGNGTGLMNGWTNNPAGPTTTFNWSVNTGGSTGSSSTGPDQDHTSGAGTYMYSESSNGSTGDQAILFSPCIDVSGMTTPGLSFWYHMYGATIGALEVYAVDGNGVESMIFSATGAQQTSGADPWLESVSNLIGLAGPIQFKFVATKGSSSTGDIAIDDFRIFNLPATNMEMTQILSPSSIICASNNETVSVEITNKGLLVADFASNNVQIAVEVNGAPAYNTTLNAGTLAVDSSLTVLVQSGADFSDPGLKTLRAYLTIADDGDLSNDTTTSIVQAVEAVSDFPYREDFEAGPGGWTSGGANSTWELGVPTNTLIDTAASGSNAWVTNLTGDYVANEASQVLSPCMDLSNAPIGTIVSLNVWWNSELSYDGAVLQSSLNLGETWQNVGADGDPNNWYTDATINGNPGGQQEGWTGRNGTGSEGWVTASHALDSSLIGQSQVLFRIAFGSDGSLQDEGFAFDAFIVGMPPVVDLGPNDTLCIGAVLDAGPGASSYLWSNGETTQTVSIQNPGGTTLDSTIIVTITDSVGLSSSDTVVITIAGALPIVTASTVVDSLCNGDQTGIARAMATSANGMISNYVWNTTPAQDSATAIGLAAGSYIVTATDLLGCAATDTITIVELPAIRVTLDTIVNVLCNGDSTGSISISVSDGVAPYSFSWSHGATSEDINGLPAGDYVGTITDAKGCVKVSPTLTVGETIEITATVDSLVRPSCDTDSTGAIYISVAGGNGAPYTFLWSNGDTTEDITDLPPGEYTGTITDAAGCSVSATISLNGDPGTPKASFTYEMAGSIIGFTNTSTGVGTNTTFAWDFGDGATDTQANPAHFYNSNDTFVVSLTVTNQCGSSTTMDTINITTVGLEEDLLNNISIFPNPSTGEFEIQFSGLNIEKLSLSVISIEGKSVYTKELGRISGNFSESIKLPATLARGIYVIQVQAEDAVIYKRIRLE